MDFSKAVKATKGDTRDNLIKDEIYDEPWTDYLDGLMQHGGGLDDYQIDKIEIEDEDGDRPIRVLILISFAESVPSGCKDYNHSHSGWVKVGMNIDRSDGSYDIDGDADVDIDDGTGRDEEDLPDHYLSEDVYPGDYF